MKIKVAFIVVFFLGLHMIASPRDCSIAISLKPCIREGALKIPKQTPSSEELLELSPLSMVLFQI